MIVFHIDMHLLQGHYAYKGMEKKEKEKEKNVSTQWGMNP